MFKINNSTINKISFKINFKINNNLHLNSRCNNSLQHRMCLEIVKQNKLFIFIYMQT